MLYSRQYPQTIHIPIPEMTTEQRRRYAKIANAAYEKRQQKNNKNNKTNKQNQIKNDLIKQKRQKIFFCYSAFSCLISLFIFSLI